MPDDSKLKNFSNLFEKNLAFHPVVNPLFDNPMLEKFISSVRHRLYDLQGQSHLPRKRSDANDQCIHPLDEKPPGKAARVLADPHWVPGGSPLFYQAFYATSERTG